MRKVFTLLLFTVLATIGVRAQEEVTGKFGTSSSYSIVSGVMTITINSTDDYKGWVNGGWGTTQVNLVNNNNVSKVVFKTGNDVTIPSDCYSYYDVWYWIGDASDKVNTIDFRNCAFVDNKVTGLNLKSKNFNVIVPDACESASSFFTGNTHNYFKVSSTTLYASLNGYVTVVWDNVKNECTTLAIEGTVSTALDLSASGFTNFNFYNTTVNADITVPDNSTVKVSTDEAKEHIKGNKVTIDYTAPAEPFNGTLTSIGGSVSSAITDYNKDNSEQISADDVKYLEVTGTLTEDDYDYIKNNLIKLVGIKLPDTYAVFPSEFSELSIKFATSDNAGVWVKNTEGGGLSAAINAIPSDWISSAKKISVSGPMNAKDMSAFSISTLKGIEIINLYDATVSDKNDYSSFSVDNSHTNVALVLAGQVTADEIKTINIGYTYKIWAIYSYSYESTMLNAWLKLSGDFSKIADCAFLAVPSVKTLSISLDDGKNLTQDHINYFNGYRNVVNLLMERARLDNVTSFSGIKNDMKRVLLPDGSDPKNFTYDGSSIKIGQSYRNNNEYIYVVKAGSLNKVPHYTNDNIKKATCIHLLGEINDDDITGFINEIQNNAISLAQAEYKGTDLTCIDNDNIEYLALPMNYQIPDVLKNNEQCSRLKAVGSMVDETIDETTKRTLYYHSMEGGLANNVFSILSDKMSKEVKISNIVMSGKLFHSDISVNQTDVHGHYNADLVYNGGVNGHWQIIRDYYDLKSADFTNAVFFEDKTNDVYDMVFSAGGILNNIETLNLPISEEQTVLPASCLNLFQKMKELCIPHNYTIIKENALYQSTISHIYTTSPNNQNINGTEYSKGQVLDLGPTSWTLPPSLELVEEGAFITNVTNEVTDVYVLNPVTPICHKDAFPAGMYYGWGGFSGNSTHPIQRSNYKNNGFMFTILHFPSGLSDEERGKYTDITRKYTFYDETGATDDDGNLYRWPTMQQFYRAYNQAVAGVTWDAWTPSRDLYDYSSSSSDYWDPSSIAKTQEEAEKLANGHIVDKSKTYDYDKYAGWHQFVLVGSTNFEKEDEKEKYWNFSKYKQNDWFTICVPFNLKKSDLLRIFGSPSQDEVLYKAEDLTKIEGKNYVTETLTATIVNDNTIYSVNESSKLAEVGDVKIAAQEEQYPEVRTLAGVTRDNQRLHILIQLSDNLISKSIKYDNGLVVTEIKDNKYVPVYEEYDDVDPVIIKANYPYFIKPFIPETEIAIANAGNRVLKYEPNVDETQVPATNIRVQAYNGTQSEAIDWQDKPLSEGNKSYLYYFVGNYIPQSLPVNSYFLATSSTTGKSTIFRNTKTTRTWGQYIAVIGAVASELSQITRKENNIENGGVANTTIEFVPENDFTFGSNLSNETTAKSFGFELTEQDNSVVTGIMLDNGNGSMSFIPSDSKIYNINGQLMSISVRNLPKGIYIINGKKIVK